MNFTHYGFWDEKTQATYHNDYTPLCNPLSYYFNLRDNEYHIKTVAFNGEDYWERKTKFEAEDRWKYLATPAYGEKQTLAQKDLARDYAAYKASKAAQLGALSARGRIMIEIDVLCGMLKELDRVRPSRPERKNAGRGWDAKTFDSWFNSCTLTIIRPNANRRARCKVRYISLNEHGEAIYTELEQTYPLQRLMTPEFSVTFDAATAYEWVRLFEDEAREIFKPEGYTWRSRIGGSVQEVMDKNGALTGYKASGGKVVTYSSKRNHKPAPKPQPIFDPVEIRFEDWLDKVVFIQGRDKAALNLIHTEDFYGVK